MPDNLRKVAENPFHVTWQLPGYPGAKLVACGADIPALHCWQQAADRILVYGKVELTACYESKEELGKYYFASTTRYLSLQMNFQQTTDAGNMIKASLAVGPSCILAGGQEQRNEVQVDGVIRLGAPTVPEEPLASPEIMVETRTVPTPEPAQARSTTPPGSIAPADTPKRKSPLPSYTEPLPVALPAGTIATRGPLSNYSELPSVVPQRTPFFPRGAESIPPMIWTMPERG